MALNKDNTVGSLTQVQNDFLFGTLLGDGNLRLQKGKKNALLEINHSIKQKEYVDWKYNIVKQFVLTPPKIRKNNGNRIAYRFTTRSLPVFTEYHHKFYNGKIKEIKFNFTLSPLALAVWFMDDGCKSRNSLYLNTQQYSLLSQKILQKKLLKQWNINSTLNRDKKYFRIRIRVNSVPKFKNIIGPYIIDSMKYKLA